MLLIDGIIHEFHMHYRAVGTPFGRDVIEATSEQLFMLPDELAYGSGSTPGLSEIKSIWRARLEARSMNLTKLQIKVIAEKLGIQGVNYMTKREVINQIERLDPHFFDPWIKRVYGEKGKTKGSQDVA